MAIGGMVIASFGQLKRIRVDGEVDPATDTERLVLFAGALLTMIAGIVAVRYLAGALRSALSEHVDPARTAPASLLVSVIGYIIVIIVVLTEFRLNLSGLLLGGALTGVIVGIAAQQTLGNFFAGLVLLVVRPFTVGERVVLRSGPLGGEFEGIVTDMSFFYLRLMTDGGPVALPNAGVLASAIGPGARSAKEEPAAPVDDHGPAHGGTS